jgi:glutamate synthase (NADPH/NADH) large chain/glutamate synthase (ferredoxin)
MVKRKGRLQPGKLFLVDLERGVIVDDADVKREVATRQPYGEWFEQGIVHLADLPPAPSCRSPTRRCPARQRAFGFTQEDLRVLLAPTAAKGEEPIGSMGNDNALAVLSDHQPPLFNYFKQLFAQVTNPPIDPIRESIVMDHGTGVGSERNLLDETPEHAHQLAMQTPLLFDREIQQLRHVDSSVFKAHTVDITWPVSEGPDGMLKALERACADADAALADGVNILILSDRAVSPERAPIPSLLAVGGVHHHLVREGTRLQTGLVLESGEPREVHHFATLIGYGCSAINPYLLLESLEALVADGLVPGGRGLRAGPVERRQGRGQGPAEDDLEDGHLDDPLLHGAQIFEAVGLADDLIDRHFTGTASRIGGIDSEILAVETLERHARGFGLTTNDLLPVGGVYAWRRDGEHHMWNPETIALLQHSGPPRWPADLRRVLQARQPGRGRGARRCAGS